MELCVARSYVLFLRVLYFDMVCETGGKLLSGPLLTLVWFGTGLVAVSERSVQVKLLCAGQFMWVLVYEDRLVEVWCGNFM